MINETIRCKTCVPENTNQKSLAGIFKTENVEITSERIQSRHLRHLKEHILAHLK